MDVAFPDPTIWAPTGETPSADAMDAAFPDPTTSRFDELAIQLTECRSRRQFLSSPQARKFEKSLHSEIEEAKARVLSLDVFDTLLLRNDKPEAERYFELSRRILDRLRQAYPKDKKPQRLTAEDLLLARAFGMSTAYRTAPVVDGCSEGVIEDVVRAQMICLNLPKKMERTFIETEILYEVENLTVNPVLLQIAKKFKDKGGKVILLSDMYLRSRQIESILKGLSVDFSHDYIYSSADGMLSKRTGKVFAKAEAKTSLAPDEHFHIGDDWIGDVARPREAGWKARYFPVSDQEHGERTRRLSDFIRTMDRNEIDVESWAKL